MASSSMTTPDSRSLSELEKGDLAKDMDEETTRPSTPSQQVEKGSPKDATPQSTVNFDDWNGPDDPDNPHNWSAWSTFYHALGPALLGFAGTFGTSVYSPAVADVMRDFDVSRTAALVCLTVYTLGLGVGPIATAPLSEGHGRKIIYTVSTPIFLLFILGAGLSKSYHSLVICRFLAGVSASPPLAVGAGSNADLFPPRKRAVATSMFLAAPFLGPALGPIIGGFVAQYKSWRWTQWCMIFVTLAAYIIALPMKETYKPVILAKRAKKAGITPPAAPASANVKSAIALKVVRPVHMLFREPAVFFFSIYNSFAFGVLFIFFAAFPYIFSRPPYSFTLSQVGLTFISIGVGVALGAATCILVDRTMYQKQHHKALARGETYTPPEHRLYSAMIGSAGIVVGLFWFGWGADKGGHWSWVLVGAIPFAWGNICLFTSTALYLVDVYGPLNGASAMAANGLSRYTISAVFPLFTVQMYEALGIGWATSLLAFLATLLLPIPWIFFKYGPKIRAKSKYPPMK